MAFYKKNIWLLFYIILAAAIFVLAFASIDKWNSIKKSKRIQQENIVKIFSKTTDSLLMSHELILEAVGNSFYADTPYKDFQKTRNTLKNISKIHPSIEAFGLAKPDGTLIFFSSHKNIDNLPNLKNQPQSRDSFIEAINSTKMILGRTYYFPPLKQYVLPIRKSIRNQQGSVTGLITAAINIKDVFGSLKKEIKNENSISFTLLRGKDHYIQYRPEKISQENETYNHTYGKKILEAVSKSVQEKYQTSIQQIKQHEKIVTVMIKNTRRGDLLLSASYNKTYDLWTILHSPYSKLKEVFFLSFLGYLGVFILVISALFYFVRLISKTEEKRVDELIHQATHDEITLLPNRNYLKRVSHKWINEEKRPFTLFAIDMDHFKNVNDTLGHIAGDRVLFEIAKRIKNSLPKNAMPIRYGGDEFLVFLPFANNNESEALANTLLEKLSTPYKVDSFSFKLGASIGFCNFPEHGKNLDSLMRSSDIAMYEAKKKRNSISFFNNALQEGYLKNISIEQALHNGIQNDEFYMVYQPQVDSDGKIFGLEALLRWDSKELGHVCPTDFIPIAEAAGNMPKLGDFIINTSLEEITTLQKETNTCFNLSINISLKQFLQEDFYSTLVESLQKRKLCCSGSLTLEVTESLFIEDLEYLLPLLNKIRSLGIFISMDDFGTGYSSLSMLKKLPIDELKIDKTFVDDILEESASQKMAQSIIDIAKNYKMKVLAEGIESKEQKNLLIKLGCDRFQGYYFSKPLKKDALLEYLKKQGGHLIPLI